MPTSRSPRRSRPAGSPQETQVKIRWIPSDECETPEGAARALGEIDGIVVPGGFGIRGIEGKLGALKFAREQGIPTLGLCLGLQCMVIEYARNVAGLEGASSSEFDPDTEFPVIATMAEQVDILDHGDMGGTMRLGLYPADLAEGSLAAELYGANRIEERHRHRYEVNNRYRDQIADAGLVFSGLSPDRNLVEYVELPRDVHPYYIATQAHPELRSRPTDPHPLFRGLVAPRSSVTVPASSSTSRMTERLLSRRALRDEPVDLEVIESDLVYEGMVWDVRSETVRYGDGQIVRQFVDHPGAAAIVAIDDDERVLLIQQYRHPIRHRDWEIPAGLLDVAGESPLETAQRELQEEVDLVAADWQPLVSVFTTPGGNDEVVHLFLARGLSPVGHAHAREAEEADIRIEWVPLDGCRHRRSRGAAAQRHPGDGRARGGRGAAQVGGVGGRASASRGFGKD